MKIVLNKAILMGRLTRDPELRHTQSNMAVCSFSLAIDRGRKNANGERETDFIDCVAWGKQAEFVCQWFTKGTMAIVVGRIQSRSWEDKNGNKRVTAEVNADEVSFGETKKSRDSGGKSVHVENDDFDKAAATGDFTELDDDSDVPF